MLTNTYAQAPDGHNPVETLDYLINHVMGQGKSAATANSEIQNMVRGVQKGRACGFPPFNFGCSQPCAGGGCSMLHKAGVYAFIACVCAWGWCVNVSASV
jgi:hypothetical protein